MKNEINTTNFFRFCAHLKQLQMFESSVQYFNCELDVLQFKIKNVFKIFISQW